MSALEAKELRCSRAHPGIAVLTINRLQKRNALDLATEVVKDGHALERATQLAQTIAAMPPLAVRAIKEAVQVGQEAPLSAALQFERKSLQLLFDSEDQKEGMRAFLEKRKPGFRGR